MSGRPTQLKLIDKGWDKQLQQALKRDHSELRIICPFIKAKIAERLLSEGIPETIRVITRFNLNDFHRGVSDTQALRILFDAGAQIRGVRNLHAKLYLFGGSRTILTSANLTQSALTRNHEFGLVATAPSIMGECRGYFNSLWDKTDKELTRDKIATWEKILIKAKVGGAKPSEIDDLPDEGKDLGFEREEQPTTRGLSGSFVLETSPDTQAFVKFFGESDNREPWDHQVYDEVVRAGCHWACCYPKRKRPRQPNDGDVMYMARLMANPSDIAVFGKAVALAHKEGRDEASQDDIQFPDRDWKENWSNYIRVYDAEFVQGTMRNGVSLNQLMDELGPDSFAATQKNIGSVSGNTNPRTAYSQQPHVMLSVQGHAWLEAKLRMAFHQHGRIPRAIIESLDWPKVPGIKSRPGTS